MRISYLFDDPLAKAAVEAAEQDAMARINSLTYMQRKVLAMIVDGNLNKETAYMLGLSLRTVENHRLAIMKRVGVDTVPQLVRLCILAGL